MNPVRGQSARAAQAVRDAAVEAALDAWRLAVEAARLQKLSDDLDALGVGVGGSSGLVTSVEGLTVGDTTHGVAAKNSPALTGVPTAPTALLGDNTTQIATTEFTQEAITAAIGYLISSAPEVLDTLTELAAALNNDPDFATTISTALGNRLRFDAAQTLSAPEKAQALSNLGLSSSSNVVGGSGSTASASSMAINCINTAVNGTGNTAINCENLTVHASQKKAAFDGVQFTHVAPVFPLGAKIKGFSSGGNKLEVVLAFTVVKSANGSVIVADADGVRPVFTLGAISPANYNTAVHEVEVWSGLGGVCTKRRVLARKGFGVTILDTIAVGGDDAPNITCTENGSNLDITLNATNNTQQYTYHVFVRSKYNM